MGIRASGAANGGIAALLGGSAGLRIFLAIALATILSQFFRSSMSVIAPELVRDVAIDAETLGLIGGTFFIVLMVLQIPVGMAFDRWGPRRVIACLGAFAAIGALWFALATTPAELVAARALIGVGCAGNFMAAVVLASRWFSQDRFTTVLSLVFAVSNVGTLAAATPLAVASDAVGWRLSFVGIAIIAGLVALVFWLVVRDAPSAATERQEPETVRQVIAGLLEVFRTPGLGRVVAIHTFAYASMLTVLGLWAGPYLADVHGLGTVARGHVVLVMGAGQITGILAFGPLDRVFGSRKRVVLGGASVVVATLATLALVPQPPLPVAVGGLVLLCFASGYTIVIVAHGRSLFPDRLIGRGVTTVNLAQAVGASILPIATGLAVGAFGAAGGGTPDEGYRAAFGLLALLLAAGAAIYAGGEDSRPVKPGD